MSAVVAVVVSVRAAALSSAPQHAPHAAPSSPQYAPPPTLYPTWNQVPEYCTGLRVPSWVVQMDGCTQVLLSLGFMPESHALGV